MPDSERAGRGYEPGPARTSRCHSQSHSRPGHSRVPTRLRRAARPDSAFARPARPIQSVAVPATGDVGKPLTKPPKPLPAGPGPIMNKYE